MAGVRTGFHLAAVLTDAGESRVAVRGAGSAARGDQHALAIAEKQ